ncbi:MAG: hypothetical protein IPK85_04185 [Gemmatimonadetes bacterium]|nr:hypothetical protein [Gemmatimonadota bacterium]
MTVAEMGVGSIAAPVIAGAARGLAGGPGQILPKPNLSPIPRRPQPTRTTGPVREQQYATSPYQDQIARATTPAQAAPVQSQRIAEADLIATRNESQAALRDLRLDHRAAYMGGDRDGARRIAQQIEAVRRQGAVADRILRDRRRVNQTPEEIAASQASLQQQYQQLREGRLLRARAGEDQARERVDQITRSGGTLGGPDLDDARSTLQAAMSERQTAEASPQALDLAIPTPEEIAARESGRRARMDAGESEIAGVLARRAETGSTLPLEVQSDRATAEAIRQARNQRAVSEAGGSPEQRMTDLAVERAGLENDVLRGQVQDAESDRELRQITRGLERTAAIDTATLQARPEIAALADQFSNLIQGVSGRSQYVDSNQVDGLRAVMSQIVALPEQERRVAARRVVQTLVTAGKADWLAPRSRAQNTDMIDRTWGLLANLVSDGSVSERGETTQSVINMVISEINRLSNAR